MTKTKSRKRKRPGQPELRIVGGKRMVLMEEAEYLRLKERADEWEPALPEPTADGNYPAQEYMDTSIALSILRARRSLGWTQVELAKKAGIRVETLNRLEHARHVPSVATLGKIERALRQAGVKI